MSHPSDFDLRAMDWLRYKQRYVKLSTYCYYGIIIKKHLAGSFDSIAGLKEENVQDFVFVKLKSGLARKTVSDIVTVLKAIVKYYSKSEGLPVPDWRIKLPSQTRRNKLQTFGMNEHRKLIRYLKENMDERNIGILLALCQGLRIGEVCSLTWDDIDLRGKTITIRHTVSRIYMPQAGKTSVVEDDPKTKSSNREIPVLKDIMPALKTLYRKSNGRYIVGDRNSPADPRNYREYYKRLLRSLGIGRHTFHALRHTFATRCVESGCDYKTLSSILGHSNISTTLNLYVHPDINQKKRCLEKMAKYIRI